MANPFYVDQYSDEDRALLERHGVEFSESMVRLPSHAHLLSQDFEDAGQCTIEHYQLDSICFDVLTSEVADVTNIVVRKSEMTLDRTHPNYPVQIAGLRPTGTTLYCRGDVSLLQCPIVAIVGTRTPTPAASERAFAIAAKLEDMGIVVLSGLALGCDTQAHLGALSGARGRTIAVLSTTMREEVYPPENQALADRIVSAGGLVLSEYNILSLSRSLRISRLIERDSLQAALSYGCIAVQAGNTSGTRHAVNATKQLGRPILLPAPMRAEVEANRGMYSGLLQWQTWPNARWFKSREMEVVAQSIRSEHLRVMQSLYYQ